MTKLFIDFETRSELDIKKVGAWRYAMHPSTEVLCMAWSEGGDIPAISVYTQDELAGGSPVDPSWFNSRTIIAHNAHFEYAVWHAILHKRYGWPALWDPKHWGCTLSRAAAANLPISLDGAGAAIGIAHKKDLEGRSVMLKLSKPVEYDALGCPVYNEDPALLQKLYDYCKRDVEAEIELDAKLPELSAEERKVWEHDLIINRRGVLADVELAGKAMSLAAGFTDVLNKKLSVMTNGVLDKASRIKAMTDYLRAWGVTLGSLDKAAVSFILKNPKVSEHVKDVVRIRQQVGKSSTAKYEAVLNVAQDSDHRMRGLLQYHAAGTGRWGGRLVQPQNFPKGDGFDGEEVVNDILAAKSPQDFWAKYKDGSMAALSAALRGTFVASPGRTFVAADYSAIEARVLLWLAGDHVALAKYKMGINLYVDMARAIYNNDKIDKKTHPKEYALGKAAILGCGYGMGKKKFYDTCLSWGIEVTEDMAANVIKTYRDKYKMVKEMWYAQEEAARAAVRTGKPQVCGKITWAMSSGGLPFLGCRLPSGRWLRYFNPRLHRMETPYGEKEEIVYWAAYSPADKKFVVEVSPDGYLGLYKTYGGSLVENITQGTARDIMANGMRNAEESGLPVVLSVHDELVTEPLVSDGKSVADLEKAMCALPAWAEGCPIAAEGWTGKRYRK